MFTRVPQHKLQHCCLHLHTGLLYDGVESKLNQKIPFINTLIWMLFQQIRMGI